MSGRFHGKENGQHHHDCLGYGRKECPDSAYVADSDCRSLVSGSEPDHLYAQSGQYGGAVGASSRLLHESFARDASRQTTDADTPVNGYQ